MRNRDSTALVGAKRLLGGRGGGGGWGGFDSRRRATLFDRALVLRVEGALVEGLVYLGVALGAVEVLVVLVVELLVFFQAAELVEDGV
ncbi:MAG: hypothetical protein JWN40_5189 [Phycisphaerales bacterium]|nr:hypothetical protein [Phycisphaerales bacterium]